MTVQPIRRAHEAHDQGLTLVEMMIGVLLFTLLSAGAFLVVSGQQRSDQTQQSSSTALDNARLTLNTIANQLRTAKAGMPGNPATGLPEGVALNSNDIIPQAPRAPHPVQCVSGSGGVSTTSGIVPAIEVIDGNDGESDRLRIIYPDGGTWGTLVAPVTAADSSISVRTPDDQSPVLPPTGWGMITDFDHAILFRPLPKNWPCSGAHCIEKNTSGNWFGGALTTIPAGRVLLRANWVEYDIRFLELGSGGMTFAASGNQTALAASTLTPGNLSDDTQPAALGIEDLQVALGVDLNNDGRIGLENAGVANADEWIHNVTGENLDASTTSSPCDLSQLLAVRISIVARTSSRDHGATTNRPQLENHKEGPVDGYHRVVLTTVVALRN